ncbi:hypothetical protein ABK040_010353 [Willaertia magna]
MKNRKKNNDKKQVVSSSVSSEKREEITEEELEGMELTKEEEEELLKEEQEEERKKLEQSGQSVTPAWTNSKWLKYLGLVFPIMLSFGDVVLFVFEYLFANTIIQTLLASVSFYKYKTHSSIHKCESCQLSSTGSETFNEVLNMNWKECISCVLSHDLSLLLLNIFYVSVWAFGICYYFTWRYGVNLKKIKKPSAKTLLVITMIGVGMGLMIYFQYKNNEWIYSLSNFKEIKRDVENPFGLFGSNETVVNSEPNLEEDMQSFEETPIAVGSTLNNTMNDIEESKVDYLKMIQLLIGAPIVEEIILRVVLVHMFFRRTGRPVISFIMTNLLFAALHIFSMQSSWNVSKVYTYFQVFSGFIIGMFYSTRYYITENLLENALLHVANNISAIFIPITLTFSDIYPKYIVPIALSLSFYIVLLVLDLWSIVKSPTKTIVPIIPTKRD